MTLFYNLPKLFSMINIHDQDVAYWGKKITETLKDWIMARNSCTKNSWKKSFVRNYKVNLQYYAVGKLMINFESCIVG